jgi:hypothetical protein
MTTELSKNLSCILTRANVEIWVEEEKIKNIKEFIGSQSSHKFIEVEGEFVNTADIVGIFSAKVMEERTRSRQGQWKDKRGAWHDKGERTCPTCPNIIPYGKQCGYCG